MTYNYETIIAEKFETIISRNIDNTRMKDYYDLYMFVNVEWKSVNKITLRKAIHNTSKNRGTLDYIDNANRYIDLISNDFRMKNLWNNYRRIYEYASNIEFIDTLKAIKVICEVVVPIEI